MSETIADRAIVIGAGMGGLAAAKAITPYFERVVVLDRDALPEAPAPRIGTPQARHVHALLAWGEKALGELFPGIRSDYGRPARSSSGAAKSSGKGPAGIRSRGAILDLSRSPCPARRSSGSAGVGSRKSRTWTFALVRVSLSWSALRIAGRSRPSAMRMKRRLCTSSPPILWSTPPAAPSRPCHSSTASARRSRTDGDRRRRRLRERHLRAVGCVTGLGGFYPVRNAAGRRARGLDPPDRERPLAGFAQPADPERGDAQRRRELSRLHPTLRTLTAWEALRTAQPVTDVARFGFPASVRRHFHELERWPRGLVPVAGIRIADTCHLHDLADQRKLTRGDRLCLDCFALPECRLAFNDSRRAPR